MKDNSIDRVDYWLQSIRSKARGAPVLLVATHAETFEAEYIQNYVEHTTAKYQKKFGDLNIYGCVPYSGVTGLNVSLIKDAIVQIASRQSYVGDALPISYLELEKLVLHEKTKRNPPVIRWEELKRCPRDSCPAATVH